MNPQTTSTDGHNNNNNNEIIIIIFCMSYTIDMGHHTVASKIQKFSKHWEPFILMSIWILLNFRWRHHINGHNQTENIKRKRKRKII